MRVFVLITLLLLTSACSTTQSSESIISEADKMFSEPLPKVFQASVDAVRAQNWRVLSVDKQNGIIKAAVPASVWTMGDEIIVFVSQRQDKVSVDVDSTSGQAYDWGKGKDNIVKFYESLRNKLQL